MGSEVPKIPSGKPSAFTVIRPKLTVSPYVKQILKRRKEGSTSTEAEEEEFEPKRLCLKQPWVFSPTSNASKVVDEVDDIELAEIQKKYKISSKQRGKWSLDFTGSSQSSIHQFWNKLIDKMKTDPIPGCNCSLKEEEKLVLIFCNFEDSLKVNALLRRMRNVPVGRDYSTLQHGTLMKR